MVSIKIFSFFVNSPLVFTSTVTIKFGFRSQSTFTRSQLHLHRNGQFSTQWEVSGTKLALPSHIRYHFNILYTDYVIFIIIHHFTLSHRRCHTSFSSLFVYQNYHQNADQNSQNWLVVFLVKHGPLPLAPPNVQCSPK